MQTPGQLLPSPQEMGTCITSTQMNTTDSMALQAVAKAEAMGWEARVNLDQSDVIDYATVVAWAPGVIQARYITFIDGQISSKGWCDRNKIAGLLDYHLAL